MSPTEEQIVDLSRVHTKLSEAEFFLAKICEQEQRFIGDKEPFDYYLSAFLNAGRTVDYRLIHQHGAIYKPWRATWDTHLASGEVDLPKIMADDRAAEVHKTGSTRSVGREGVALGIGEHHLPPGQGMIIVSGPPDMPPGELYRPTYNYTINGIERKATDACKEYLALLRRIVTEFEAAYP
jgi:hypothetical protein